MASQKPVKPVSPHHLTAKQLAADRSNLRKARAVAARLPRSGKQKAASRHNLAKARAVQKARRSGKAPVAAKKPQAVMAPVMLSAAGSPSQATPNSLPGLPVSGLPTPETGITGLSDAFRLGPADAGPLRNMSHPQLNLELPGEGPTENDCNLYLLPACAPVALAEHLAFWTGVNPGTDDILALHQISSGQCTLADLLELATVEGLAGIRLESFQRCDPDLNVPGWIYGLDTRGGYHAVLAHPAGTVVSWGSSLPWPGAPREAWHLEWAES